MSRLLTDSSFYSPMRVCVCVEGKNICRIRKCTCSDAAGALLCEGDSLVFPPAATCATLTACLIFHFFLSFYYSSDLNQDSLDGAQASVSEVGSAEEFEKENTEDTPSGSHGEADGNQRKILTTYSLRKVVKRGVWVFHALAVTRRTTNVLS